jgi:acetyl esterase/lipase
MNFKAVLAQYPVLDVASPFFSQKFDHDKLILGNISPDPTVLEEHLQTSKEILAADETLSRLQIVLAIINEGHYFEYLKRNTDSELAAAKVQPIKCLELVKTEQIPFMFVIHGKEDTGVPVGGTEEFEKRLKELHPGAAARFVYETGQHGFDRDATLQDQWLKDGLSEVAKFWPAQK